MSEWTIDTFKELMDERQQRNEQALKLQASEYERRLEALNHENDRLNKSVAANVSNDTWVGFLKQYKEDSERTASHFDKSDSFQNKILGMALLATVVVPIVVSVIVYVLTRHSIPTGG
jgi:hypothetical protein